jgi:HEAT repeat protein
MARPGRDGMTLQEFSDSFRQLGPRARVKALAGLIQDLPASERSGALLWVLHDSQSTPLVRTAALKLLKDFCYEDPELFRGFLGDRNQAVVKASARVLKEIEILHKRTSPIAKAFLKKLAATGDWTRRLKILRAVARIRAAWSQPVLIESLADPSEHVRDFLIRELAGREVLNRRLLLQRLSVSGPWYGKSAVIKIMGLRKGAQFVKSIAPAVDDPNVDVRRSAAEALGEIGGEDSLCLLVKLADDKNPYVKKTAEDALRKASNLKFS